ncbi:AMP-dependent synthetase [Acuticoccus sediminis]|uniref:AMP-dependent synthetase n=1 Tax=Acuticoccus sediminis TaxID=2184697 RepID=A0A8B2NRU6_9HYPH|nr:fatty acyl-AMP ligase [Acuticoccus sediminis]RAI00083.1 AMP-dependent synthetase [Acuticoccus sediminis]
MSLLAAPPSASSPRDLVATLMRHAGTHGDRLALRFLRRGEHVEEEVTYAELDRSVRIVAANLRAAGLARRPVLIALPQGLDFVRCFLGCLYAGAIAVPTTALGDPRGAERLARIIEHAQPAALVAPQERRELVPWADLCQRAPGLRFLAAHDLLSGTPSADLPARAPEEIAFLQYTSGATSAPKGVAVTCGNISANLAMIEAAFGQDATNSSVSWLPLHHDMGLIGCVLEPLILGASTTLMSPLAFLQRPIRWLRAMDRFEATTAGAPNFAYDLCVRAVDAETARTLDLSRWSLAFCGSEPIRAATLTRFAGHFAAARFPATSFYPCYGLAEATLFVTGNEAGRGVETVDLPRESGGAVAAVSCGFPRRGTSVAVLDPERDALTAPGSVGEIAVAGDAVSPGFWHPGGDVRPDPDRAATVDGKRYLRTGDLGVLRDGALFVVGRRKNMIIVRGTNIYAEDIEQTVMAHPAAAPFGAIAALGVLDQPDAADPEGVRIVCELSRAAGLPDTETLPTLGRAVAEAHGVLPVELVIVPNGAIERTVSGKLRRDATRSRLDDGALPVLQRHEPRAGNPSSNPSVTEVAHAHSIS